MLKRGLLAGGTVAVGGVVIGGLPKLVTAAPSPSQDAKMRLERLMPLGTPVTIR